MRLPLDGEAHFTGASPATMPTYTCSFQTSDASVKLIGRIKGDKGTSEVLEFDNGVSPDVDLESDDYVYVFNVVGGAVTLSLFAKGPTDNAAKSITLIPTQFGANGVACKAAFQLP
jgi:hypothetical protein